MRYHSLRLVLVGGGLILGLLPAIVLAAGTAISPPLEDITLNPGQARAEFELAVTNHNTTAQTYKISTTDFGALDESGGVAFLGATQNTLQNKYGLISWIKLPKDSLTIGPEETQKLNIVVENRDNLSPGGHYGAILVSPLSVNAANPNSVEFKHALSSLLFVKKIGGEHYGLSLDKLERQSSWWQNLKLTLRFNNSGNVHVIPRGTVSLYDPRGREVAKGVINQDSSTILPETHRIFSLTMMRLGGLNLPGRYKLVTRYRYDGKDDFTTVETSLDYFNPGIVAGFGLILLVLIGGGWWLWRRLRRRI